MSTLQINLNKKNLLIGAGAVAVLVAGGFAIPAVLEATAPKPAPFTLFSEARSSCGSEGVEVSDNGLSLSVDMMGEEDWSGAPYTAVDCIIQRTEITSFIEDNIYNTNALAGRQSDTYEIVLGGEGTDWAETVFEIEVQWSYHPDNGLDLTYQAAEVVKTDG